MSSRFWIAFFFGLTLILTGFIGVSDLPWEEPKPLMHHLIGNLVILLILTFLGYKFMQDMDMLWKRVEHRI